MPSQPYYRTLSHYFHPQVKALCEWELSLAYPLPPACLRQNIVTAPSDTYFPFWHFNLLIVAGWFLLCSAMFRSLFFVRFTVLLTRTTTLIPGRKFANLIKSELRAHIVSHCCYKTLSTHAEKTNILLVQRQQPALPEKQSTWQQTSHFQTETRGLDLPASVFPEHSGCASWGNLHTIKAAVHERFWWHLNFYF